MTDKKTEQPGPTRTPQAWGPEQAIPLNDPDSTLIYDGILEPGDPVLKQANSDVSLYNEAMADDQVISTFNQRKRAVISAPLVIEPGGEKPIDVECADRFRMNLAQLPMDDITDKILNALFFGYMPQENLWKTFEGQIWLRDIKSRKPERFVIDQDQKLRMLTNTEIIRGVETDPLYFWYLTTGAISHDNPYGLGIGYYVYYLAKFKKSGIKFWLKYLEKFAQPTMVGKFPINANDADIKKLLETIRALSSDFGTAIPDDMVIEMIEATRSGTADYKTFREMANASISKIVLGQTMTTDDGSSNAQSRTHQKTKTDNAKGDADIFSESFTRNVAKVWQEINYPTAATPICRRDVEPRQSTIEMAKADAEIFKLGWKLTDEKFAERYGEGYEKKPDIVPDLLPGAVDDDKKNDEVIDEDEVEFSEAFVDQGLIDDALDAFIDAQGQNISESILTDLMEFSSTHSPQETLDELNSLITSENLDALEENLGRVMVAAATVGRVND